MGKICSGTFKRSRPFISRQLIIAPSRLYLDGMEGSLFIKSSSFGLLSNNFFSSVQSKWKSDLAAKEEEEEEESGEKLVPICFSFLLF